MLFFFLSFSLLHQSFVLQIILQHSEMRRKWPFWGQRSVLWPFCDFWTVPSTVLSCTVMTVPKFRNDGLTLSFTASTVRPYFDGPYRHTVIAQAWFLCHALTTQLTAFIVHQLAKNIKSFQTLPSSQVRKYMKTIIKPGIPLTDMCETLEGTVRKLIDERGLDAGGHKCCR
jgi:hypothetical protein